MSEEKSGIEIVEGLKTKAQWVRQTVLDMSVKAKSGHVTTAFSQAEMLVALYYGGILRVDPKNPKWPERDRFILSKGQGGIGTYPVLADKGFFPLEWLDNFAKPGSVLGVHAEWNIPGVELLTGSLGHGLPMATGMALHLLQKYGAESPLVVVLLGDGEHHEGSNWEAMMFAHHYNLSNLICIVDRNKQSTLGFHDGGSDFCDPFYHKDGPCLNPLDEKYMSFGFEVRTVQDGHNFNAILPAFTGIRTRVAEGRSPLCIISKTSKGRGTTITENQRLWHYRVPDAHDYEIMKKELAMGLDEFDAYKVRMNYQPASWKKDALSEQKGGE